MKKLIRFLASVSGVEEDIRIETIEEIGGRLRNESHWFSGLYYGQSRDDLSQIYFVLNEIGNCLVENKWYNIDTIRNKVVNWIERGKNLEEI